MSFVLALLSGSARALPHAQSGDAAPGLKNGDMETVASDGKLAGWYVPPGLIQSGYAIGPHEEEAFQGARAARIDSRTVTSAGNIFANLSQSLDARPYQGKRVRFRTAVKVAEDQGGGRAQMWLRVDLASTGSTPSVGFFDNMSDRPIEAGEWEHHEIVGDVAADARTIVLGVMTFGQCLVLVDDASLEIVDKDVMTTVGFDLAEAAPIQPFFTWWLVLPVIAIALFACGFLARGRLGKFALEFTLVYWVLYALPTMLSSLVPVYGLSMSRWLEAKPLDAFVRWSAADLLGIETTLVSAIDNGSGDSTYSYVQTLMTFVVALLFALVWSLVDRRATDHARLEDLPRSGLRYYLATMMMGYGISKISTLGNQFPPPESWRLAQTYGESSPMGLLWTFMGSSRAYTAFAGSMEALGGLLLVWRRTALLGALVSVGVMLNVMLLNFCYDTPVKLFSLHLVVAGALVALPDAGRLLRFLLGLGSGASAVPSQPFTGRRARWIHRGLKAYLVGIVVAWPLFTHWRSERRIAPIWPALGEWNVAAIELDGEAVQRETGEVARLTLLPWATVTETGWSTGFQAELVGGGSVGGQAALTENTLRLEAEGSDRSLLVPGEFAWSADAGGLVVTDETAGVRASLVPTSHDHLLMRRGFRWINEHPFNR